MNFNIILKCAHLSWLQLWWLYVPSCWQCCGKYQVSSMRINEVLWPELEGQHPAPDHIEATTTWFCCNNTTNVYYHAQNIRMQNVVDVFQGSLDKMSILGLEVNWENLEDSNKCLKIIFSDKKEKLVAGFRQSLDSRTNWPTDHWLYDNFDFDFSTRVEADKIPPP
jgi:hypothetical protein